MRSRRRRERAIAAAPVIALLTATLAVAACGSSRASECGDGVCTAPETQASCPADCGGMACGDHLCSPAETAATCPVDCYCGNGSCDAQENPVSCPSDCSLAVCGNRLCEPTEDMLSCGEDCPDPVCGNGACEPGESMLDCPTDCLAPDCGNDLCEPGESALSCVQDCPAVCGNHVLEPGEECDTVPPPGETCATVAGHAEGTLRCTACSLSTAECFTCGDGHRQAAEACDGAELGGRTCASLGHDGGTLGCTAGCAIDETGCSDCGNGILEADEVCDAGLFVANAPTCADLGFDGGVPTCAGDCLSVQSSGCFACGDGICDAGKGEDEIVCPADCGFVDVSAGRFATCGVRANGTVWCWGRVRCHGISATPVQLSGLSDVAQIRLGQGYHDCALRNDGRVVCWGAGNWGQLGDGQSAPTHTICPPAATTALTNVISLSVGYEHSCAVRTDGTLHCWGSDGPVLGLGNAQEPDICYPYNTTIGYSCAFSPVRVPSVSGAVEVASFWDTNAVRLSSGAVLEWGWVWFDSYSDIVGLGTPRPVPGAAGALSLAVGHGHGCFSTQTNGAVWCWGNNFWGQLGRGTLFTNGTEAAAQVSGLSGIVDVGASSPAMGNLPESTSCAVSGAGSAWCWGFDGQGQLGNGAAGPTGTPSAVVGLTDVIKVVGGLGHLCALTSSAEIWCWGENGDGQLGDGTTTDATEPVRAHL